MTEEQTAQQRTQPIVMTMPDGSVTQGGGATHPGMRARIGDRHAITAAGGWCAPSGTFYDTGQRLDPNGEPYDDPTSTTGITTTDPVTLAGFAVTTGSPFNTVTYNAGAWAETDAQDGPAGGALHEHITAELSTLVYGETELAMYLLGYLQAWIRDNR